MQLDIITINKRPTVFEIKALPGPLKRAFLYSLSVLLVAGFHYAMIDIPGPLSNADLVIMFVVTVVVGPLGWWAAWHVGKHHRVLRVECAESTMTITYTDSMNRTASISTALHNIDRIRFRRPPLRIVKRKGWDISVPTLGSGEHTLELGLWMAKVSGTKLERRD